MNTMRSLELAIGPNDGRRTLKQSIMVPEVWKALSAFSAGVDADSCILIGGIAFSYYCKPRATTDLDFLFLSKSKVPMTVDGFKRTRSHAFQHHETHVEVEVLDPEFVNMSQALAKRVAETAHKSDGVLVASPEALVALKTLRFSRRDQADIEELKELPAFVWTPGWDAVLTAEQRQRFASI